MTYEKPTKFARSARRHRIGRTHAYFVMEHTQAHVTESEHYWVGVDDRGVE